MAEAELAMPADLWNAVEAVLESRRPIALAVTGGGSLALTWLLDHPGASRAIVEAQIPYNSGALAAYLGQAPSHSASAETARLMAQVAAARARRFGTEAAGRDLAEAEGIGVGLTAALTTTRPRRGEDRAQIAIRTGDRYLHRYLRLARDTADRHAQEQAVSLALIDLLTLAVGTKPLAPELPAGAERIDTELPVEPHLEALLTGDIEAIELSTRGGSPCLERRNRLLVSGSFNPLHDGHRGLARAAARASGRAPSLELSVVNVDKPSLSYLEVMGRWEQMKAREDALIITREPTFDGKARLFPGCDFAIGYDTAVRVIEPRYYGSEEGMRRALDFLIEGGSRFFVAGRLWQGAYHGLSRLPVPARYQELFVEIPEQDFRTDISSTELRDATS